MLASLAFLFLAGTATGPEALKPAEKAFHAPDSVGPELLSRALRLEQELRDWSVLQFPRQDALVLRRAGILRAGDVVEVSRPREFPKALLVRVSLKVPSGVDSAAWLYESRDGKWVRTLSLERMDRMMASQLYGVAFSPPDKSGTHLAVAVRGPSGGSGCWHTVRFQVYRVGTPTPPPLLMDDLHPANLCGHEPVAKAEVDGFSVTLQDRDLPAGSIRVHVLRYQLFAERPRRVQPVALGPREFVDEWLERGWNEAVDWTAPRARAVLQKVHQELGGNGAPVSGDYRSAARCGDGHWEVAIELARHGARYFQVKDLGNNEFQLLGVRAAGSDCGAH